MTNENKNTEQKKNMLDQSSIAAGGNVQIGDVYHIHNTSEIITEAPIKNGWLWRIRGKATYIFLAAITVVSISLSIKEFELVKNETGINPDNNIEVIQPETQIVHSGNEAKSNVDDKTTTPNRNTQKIESNKRFQIAKTSGDEHLFNIALTILRNHFQKNAIYLFDEKKGSKMDGEFVCNVNVIKHTVKTGIRSVEEIAFNMEVALLPNEGTSISFSETFESRPFVYYAEEEIPTIFKDWVNEIKPTIPNPKK